MPGSEYRDTEPSSARTTDGMEPSQAAPPLDPPVAPVPTTYVTLTVTLPRASGIFGIEELLRTFDAVFEPYEARCHREGPEATAPEGPVTITARLPVPDPGETNIALERDEGDAWKATLTVAGRPPEVVTVDDGAALRERQHMKLLIYHALARRTGRHAPWGALTGVHPTMIIRRMPARDDDQAATRLERVYDLAPSKAALGILAARAEEALLAAHDDDGLCLYVDVPFCPSRCAYCSFALPEGIGSAETLETPYVEAMLAEMTSRRAGDEPLAGRRIDAVYIGGGTPAALSVHALDRLLGGIRRIFPEADTAARTIEAGRADVLDEAKLACMLTHGFDRICLNPQTLCDATLRRVNRRHDAAAFEAIFRTAKALGFRTINADLIAGLPGEDPAIFRESLERLLTLDPDAVTVHALALKRASDLYAREVREAGRGAGRFSRIDPEEEARRLTLLTRRMARDEDVRTMVREAERRLTASGYAPYYLYRQKRSLGGAENTGYAKAGHATYYNVAMMSNRRDVAGFGTGASTLRMEGGRTLRRYNKRGIREYIREVLPDALE